MALWTRPSSDFELHKALLYCNMASRVALEIKLEQSWLLSGTGSVWCEDELEIVNRQRTYLIVFGTCRSLGQPCLELFRSGQKNEFVNRGMQWASQPLCEVYDPLVIAIIDLFRRSVSVI